MTATDEGLASRQSAAGTPSRRSLRAAAFARVAADHAGVAHRAVLLREGVTRADLRTEIRAGRWRLVGRHTVLLAGAELADECRWWSAVWESGPGAVLDGVTALTAAGLRKFEEETVHVSVPSSNRVHRSPGVTVHRPNTVGPVIYSSVPRVRPELACLRAAAWARTDRTAALLVSMSVQQRIVDRGRLIATWDGITYSAKRSLLDQVIRDVCDGAESLGELDFGALCAAYGLPRPNRQIRRVRPSGVAYVDAGWESVGLLVEIDGVHHLDEDAVMDDALRQNDLVLGRERVLRIPLMGLRTEPARFMRQVVRAYRQAPAM
ncbi:hypothetical protein [Allobranchiibius sp. CTAmp26]|uniref:hypothetical protein n=1 Tax=Allobranchiibius sp. CTAmp26 TaxID=2815214 RepID=UPI001AA1D3EC|nr:hypothetical protein [Allobranchiibius sp. CTAmp26]MBO1754048.1 hypothetical protein [Allobranchiibius sp. CTAmp26]